jgi:serine/threonine protein kinase/Tol biopolymer transport system component
MGEVYRARDTRLNRDIAIKVLPDAFANDPERLARFTREAQTLAALNHPNIGGIYGLEEANGVTALVMELVEGADLSQRIARGPIPLDEALPIGRQIVEALEAAHEQGIIHRDLKPANIKVRADGTVKVLDFGLAKLRAGEVSGDSDYGRDSTHSPTLTSPAMMTGAGMILGTAAYMSPEQARGRPVDKRADIWSFGVVLFEMLAGQRPFSGETISDTLASVLKTEPNWHALPAAAPPRLRGLLRRCLDKDAKRRLRDIGDARVQIEELLSGAPDEAGVSAIPTPQSVWQRALPWGVAAAALVVAAVATTRWAPWRKPSSSAPLRLSADLGAGADVLPLGASMSVSPDGATVAFVAQTGAARSRQLYVRRLSQLQATPLSGTDNAVGPFFSPDGQWIGFFADGKLRKIAATGGPAVTLCDAPNSRGAAWAEDGTIVFLPNQLGSLMRVSSEGGTPAPLLSLVEGEVTQRFPQVLPGGKAVLFTGSRTSTAFNDANLVVQALPTGTRTVVQRGGYHGRYLPSGHLVYLHDGTLFAAPFDLERLVVTGPPVSAVEGVASNEGIGSAQFAVSASGTLVYLPGQSTGGGVPIHWMDREGKTMPLRASRANWLNLLFAPDGLRLALEIFGEQADIWVFEWARDSLTRVTSDPSADTKPVWTPDGRRLVFASARSDSSTPNLYWQRADGTGAAQRLTESKNPQQPASWHPSGTFLAFEEQHPTTKGDLMILTMEGDEASGWKPGTPTVFLNSPFEEREPMFSPDGRWLAYWSTESGRDEVYVRPFPGPGGQWPISTGGGSAPTWSRTKRELLYTLNGQIMVAGFTVEGDAFRAEKPRLWSEGRHVSRGLFNRMFDLHVDGERVALAPSEQVQDAQKSDHLTFIFNFFDELRRIAPATR